LILLLKLIAGELLVYTGKRPPPQKGRAFHSGNIEKEV
jgi:hypothetical protein